MGERDVQNEGAHPNPSLGEGLSQLGIVAIGRNEGERFVRCVESLVREAPGCTIIYVDSGSTDGSVEFARGMGVEVVQLDMSRPFTAARARNAGLERLLEVSPSVQFVQFIDGDCEVIAGWLEAGVAALAGDERLAAVSGRLRERFPERSIYNRLADIEWDRPVGEEKSCGGVAMMRVSRVREVGGFDSGLIAGEEPELCARMRERGGRIMRLAHDMAWHDLAMTTSAQWFKRARRHGHAIIEVSYFKTTASRGLFAGQVRSAVTWGVGWPVGLLALLFSAAVLIGLDHYRLGTYVGLAAALWFAARWTQGERIAGQARKRGMEASLADRYGWLLLDSKWHQVRGMIDFLWRRWRGKRAEVISYKESTAPAA
jgi:GT2 family glycosyltransferase